MALWLVRAGRHGEYEQKFFEENRIYLAWDRLLRDLSGMKSSGQLRNLLEEIYSDALKGRISNHVGQIWAFSQKIKVGDWIILPSKQKPAIHIAEVKGNYTFNPEGENPFFHYRNIEWIAQDVPRTNFDQDLLYSFGASMAICQVSRNDAEIRVRNMAKNGWKIT